MKETRNSIRISRNGISISVSVHVFNDGNAFVAYCPSLDISGYDTTEEKAKQDFNVVLTDWLKEQVAQGTLQGDLKAHGWTI